MLIFDIEDQKEFSWQGRNGCANDDQGEEITSPISTTTARRRLFNERLSTGNFFPPPNFPPRKPNFDAIRGGREKSQQHTQSYQQQTNMHVDDEKSQKLNETRGSSSRTGAWRW